MKKFNSRGKCLCGSIKFSTKGFHRDVSSCHCIQCMKTHGNFAAYTNVEDKNLKCGASIFFKFKNSKTTSISAGIFDKSLKVKTTKNIFIKNKLKFYKIDRSLPKFNRYS